MSRIKVKNFGPIREGFVENDGWLDIKKVTVLIGNQGSGKSTVAKLISVFSWLEKNIVRKSITTEQLNVAVFKNLCRQQEIIEYFSRDTLLIYEGGAYEFKYDEKTQFFEAKINANNYRNYVLPKIQYVSAARNLLTILYNISFKNIVDKDGNVIDLASNIPIMVKELNKEYINALMEFANEGFALPINDTSVYFKEHRTFVKTGDKPISMSAASSGVQSITPLLLVSHYLSENVQGDIFDKIQNIDDNLKSKIENELLKEDEELTDKFKQIYSFGKGILPINDDALMLKEILKQFIPSSFINIVEEPEQNLFPNSQRNVVNTLLKYNNNVSDNKLIITTHSPYVINYLMLSIKASEIEQRCGDNKEIKSRLYEIVPEKASTPLQDVAIYELDENTGTISKLKESFGLPSNENYLNDELGESNVLFSKLLEIENLCQQ